MIETPRLFLGSDGLSALPAWLASLPSPPRRAALVPTAARPLPSAPFVDAAARLLRSEGIAVEYLDLAEADPRQVQRTLERVEVTFVTGGYAMFLLQHAHRTGFYHLVKAAAHSGRLAYAGTSAGAALAGPDLEPLRGPDDPGIVTSTTGLNLVPFVVLAHRNRGRADLHDRQAAQHHGRLDLISINDDQAIVVHGATWEITTSLITTSSQPPGPGRPPRRP